MTTQQRETLKGSTAEPVPSTPGLTQRTFFRVLLYIIMVLSGWIMVVRIFGPGGSELSPTIWGASAVVASSVCFTISVAALAISAHQPRD